MLIWNHNAIQFGHVGNAHIGAWAVAGFGFCIRVRTLYATLRICNEFVYFISRFHELTFGNTVARNKRRISVGHLAFFCAIGFWSGYWWIIAHVQQRYEAKHCIRFYEINTMRRLCLCLFFCRFMVRRSFGCASFVHLQISNVACQFQFNFIDMFIIAFK